MSELPAIYETCEAIEFYADSDVTVTMGAGKHIQDIPVRCLNDADFEDLGRQLYGAFQALRNRKSAPGAVAKFAIKRQIQTFVASALSNPDEGRAISIGFLRSCPPGQIPLALRAIVEGNKAELLEAYQMLPESFRKPLGDLGNGAVKSIVAIFKSGASLNKMVDDLAVAIKDVAEQAADVAGPLLQQPQSETDSAGDAETYLHADDVFPADVAPQAPPAYVEEFQEYAQPEGLPAEEVYSASSERPEPSLIP